MAEGQKGPRSGWSTAAPYLFVAPFFVLFAGFILYPILYSAALSFGQFSGGSISFVGLENYRRLLSDGLFLKSLLNTGLILVIQVPLMIGLATVIASVIDSDLLGKRRKAAFRLAFFLPVAIDLVTYSVVFSLIFSERYGVVNQALGLIGLDGIPWRSDPFWARVLIILAVTWRWTGYNAVILLSGLQNIPKDLYDAASVDGAGSVTRFLRITVPLLRPVILFCTVLGTIGTLQLFTEPYILTGGGPNNATLTSFFYIYDTGFARFDFGLAAAGTYVLSGIVAAMSYAQIRLARWGRCRVKGRSRRMSEPARLILYIFLGVGALVTLYPFYWTLTAATLTESEIFKSPPRLLPGGEFFVNLRTLSESVPFIRALLNSIFVATVTTVSTVFLSALAGYAFAKFRFRGRKLMFVVVLGTLMLPTEIMIIPLFIIMLQLGWVDSYAALIVPYLVTGFGVFLMRQQMMGFPNDLLDAARIDGNGELGAFFRVVLPNMKAACAALGIVTFMSQWGNFLWPLVIISTPEKFTYPLMLSSLVRQGGAVEYAPIMVAAVIGLIPLILLFFFFQKYIVSGVFGGSLKE